MQSEDKDVKKEGRKHRKTTSTNCNVDQWQDSFKEGILAPLEAKGHTV